MNVAEEKWVPVGIAHPGRRGAYHLIVAQCVLGIGITILCYAFFSTQTAYSALLGVAIAVVANVYFTKRAFAITGARVAQRIVRNIYRAQALKMLISVLMFAVCFRYIDICGWSFFVSYAVIQLSTWLSPLFL